MTFSLPLITERTDLKGKRVLLRLDLNVPIEEGKIRDTYRIDQSLPTLEYLHAQGARTIVIAHLGKGKMSDTLQPVATYLRDKFPIKFLSVLMDPDNKLMIERMRDGDVVMLENLRHSKGEEENNPDFAKYLSSLAEIYVNDAFAVSHRAHASVVGVAERLPHYAGILLQNEIEHLSQIFDPTHPFVFILGGAKISTKIPLLKKFLGIADHVVVGGANANNFFKAKGFEVGKSVIDEDALDGLLEYSANPKLIIPNDVVIQSEKKTKLLNEIAPEDMIVDIGKNSIEALRSYIEHAKLIVWNGPLGFYEEGFTEGSQALLELIANSDATSIIGGGDTVALIDSMGALSKFTFVSTGGGAMLDFLAEGTLPGIDVLRTPTHSG